MGTYHTDPSKPCPRCGGTEYEINDDTTSPGHHREGNCNNFSASAYWGYKITPNNQLG